jgi:hypothetical protein
MSALRPGDIVWRIGERSRAPLRCIVVRDMKLGLVEVRSSTFARQSIRVLEVDIFADREACRAEINRRAEANP